MVRSFFILAVRHFIKNSVYSLINILGLSVGLATFIILLLFVKYESSWDTFHKDYERIFRVEQKVTLGNTSSIWNQMPAPASIELQRRYPEVEEAITIREVWGEYLSTSKERTFYENDGYYANPDVFNLFTINFIAGDKKTALSEPMKIVLTESLAKKLFPNSDAMGQNILVDNKRTYQVSAIIEDFPFNTNTRASYFISFSTYANIYNEDYFDHWEWDRDARVYVKLKKNVDSKLFENKIANMLDDFLEDRNDKLKLKPIRNIHLQQSDQEEYWIVVVLYGIVGLFTLLMAAMNFVNLTTANSLSRIKEIGIKKVVGCRKGSLVKQFLLESLIIVFISLLIAFTITEAVLPVFNRIVSLPLDFSYIEDWQFTLFIIGITFVTGVLSGLYPALVMSSLSPLDSLKGKIFNNSRMKNFSMRKSLVVIQLLMSVSFVMISLSILNQFNYLKDKDLGFDKNNLLISSVGETDKVKINEFSALRNELLQLSGVTEVSVSYNSPFYGSWSRNINWEGGQAGDIMNSRYNRATATFIPIMKIDLVAGRNFNDNLASDSVACIVNQKFINSIGWSPEEAIGKKVWENNYTIVGVMKDFHEQSPFIEIQPYLLTHHPGYLNGSKKIIVRVNDTSDKELFGQVKSKLEEYFPENYVEVRPYDNNLGEGTYSVYLGLAKTFGFFSMVSIIIGIIGLFTFVSYSEKRRVKEIGIRKVLGATPMQIYRKLAQEYIVLILIANAIAIPLGTTFYFIDPSYYKQSLSVIEIIWICLLSIVIILLTISIQVIKSSYTNPLESLRYE